MNILTFDIEEWWVYDHYKIGKPSVYLPRLDRYLNEILDLLDYKEFSATFFCLGEVAKKYPKVIRRIYERGHHIGCHSYSHDFYNEKTDPRFFKKDTLNAINVLEDVIGQKINSYRAPAFSISEKTKWMFEILIDAGIDYDCSIFPGDRSFGGFKNFKNEVPITISSENRKIREFPVSVTKILNKYIASAGGGYFKLIPYAFLKSIINHKSDYLMTYFHLKDFDKEQEKKYSSFKGESAFSRYLKNYYGLNGSFLKFKYLINDFEFMSVEKAAENIIWENQPLININNL